MALRHRWVLVGLPFLVLFTFPSTASAAARYRAVVYDGVSVTVPASWPVLDGNHSSQCDGPFSRRAAVYLGPNLNGWVVGEICGLHHYNGVWMHRGQVGGSVTTLPSGVRVRLSRPQPLARTRGSKYAHDVFDEAVGLHGVTVEIGIGPNPRTARRILDSVRRAPGTPTTRASEPCWVDPRAPAMPQPERLTTTLVLDHGTFTLTPLAAGTQPLIAATTAWHDHLYSPIERYRMVLANFQSGPSAAPVPDWVILSSPGTTAYTGCGYYGITTVQADTGQVFGNIRY